MVCKIRTRTRSAVHRVGASVTRRQRLTFPGSARRECRRSARRVTSPSEVPRGRAQLQDGATVFHSDDYDPGRGGSMERLISSDSHVNLQHDSVKKLLAPKYHDSYDTAVAEFQARVFGGNAG